MNATELRKLDVWICHNVFGRKDVMFSNDSAPPRYTINPGDAMALLDECIRRSKKSVCCCISVIGYQVYCGGADYAATVREAKTLPLAVALFAKGVFQ